MYILDTDICSYLIKRSHSKLNSRVRRFKPRELKVSAVTVYELQYGARRSESPRVGRVVGFFLANVEVLLFGRQAAREAARVRAELEAQGKLIGAYDLQIAGHARAMDATLVTNNVREFSRVKGLKVENWT